MLRKWKANAGAAGGPYFQTACLGTATFPPRTCAGRAAEVVYGVTGRPRALAHRYSDAPTRCKMVTGGPAEAGLKPDCHISPSAMVRSWRPMSYQVFFAGAEARWEFTMLYALQRIAHPQLHWREF